jgi:hypothetical protein
MAMSSTFESRTGSLKFSAPEIFAFAGDMRNFNRFVPDGTISNWKAEADNCSFNVAVAGTVTVRIKEKTEFERIVYEGDALKKEDFILTLFINGVDNATVKVRLEADLNPVMKMMASKPIEQFLEMLIREMENFNGWTSSGQ